MYRIQKPRGANVLIRIPLVIGLMYLFIHTKNAILCASIWGALILVLAILLNSGFSWIILVVGVISFLVALGVFALLDYLEGSPWWWPAMIGGLAVLMLI